MWNLSKVLCKGNRTCGHDIVITSGDKIRGSNIVLESSDRIEFISKNITLEALDVKRNVLTEGFSSKGLVYNNIGGNYLTTVGPIPLFNLSSPSLEFGQHDIYSITTNFVSRSESTPITFQSIPRLPGSFNVDADSDINLFAKGKIRFSAQSLDVVSPLIANLSYILDGSPGPTLNGEWVKYPTNTSTSLNDIIQINLDESLFTIGQNGYYRIRGFISFYGEAFFRSRISIISGFHSGTHIYGSNVVDFGNSIYENVVSLSNQDILQIKYWTNVATPSGLGLPVGTDGSNIFGSITIEFLGSI